MKKITIFLLLISLFSCWKTENWAITACKDEIKKSLKDPYSVVWEWEPEIVMMKWSDSEEWAMKISYNAKNSYGAYSGISSEYCTFFKKTDWDYYIDTWWIAERHFNGYKNGKTNTEITDDFINSLK